MVMIGLECFQGKKDVAQIFNNILRRHIGSRTPTVEYICTKPEILFTLIAGYVQVFNVFFHTEEELNVILILQI